MNNVFLDCGSNLGQGYEHFKTVYGDSYKYILFEPNPHCYEILKNKYGNIPNVEIYNKAVSNVKTTFTFYYNEDYSQGGSIIENHNSYFYNSKDVKKITVDSINLIEFINNIFNENTNIIIKLDVESSEYDILESLISTKTIFKLSKIYCEFHSNYMSHDHYQQFLNKEHSILNFVKSNNINFELWH